MTRSELIARSNAMAFRIWQFCQPREWQCTYREVAEGTGLSINTITQIARRRGWIGRIAADGHDTEWRHGNRQRQVPQRAEEQAIRDLVGANVGWSVEE